MEFVKYVGEDKGWDKTKQPPSVIGARAQGPQEIDHDRSFFKMGKLNEAFLSKRLFDVNANARVKMRAGCARGLIPLLLSDSMAFP